MELWEELLYDLSDEEISEYAESIGEILESKCYKLLEEIKKILKDETLEDASCFERIERIVRAYEKAGSNGGTRHDFG